MEMLYKLHSYGAEVENWDMRTIFSPQVLFSLPSIFKIKLNFAFKNMNISHNSVFLAYLERWNEDRLNPISSGLLSSGGIYCRFLPINSTNLKYFEFTSPGIIYLHKYHFCKLTRQSYLSELHVLMKATLHEMTKTSDLVMQRWDGMVALPAACSLHHIEFKESIMHWKRGTNWIE